jgi:hypothetical protein
MYVPDALAPLIRRALRNGRTIEQLLSAMGPTLLHQYRQQRALAADRHAKPAKKPRAKN